MIGCAQLGRSAEFWTGALGYVRDGTATGHYQSLWPTGGRGLEMLLQQVPEGKQSKNRVHLDLRTRDLESETQRLVSVGARILTQQPVAEAGWRWHILSDPEGSVQIYA